MARDRSSLLPATSAEWDKACDVVRRLIAARSHLARDSDEIGPPGPLDFEPPLSVTTSRPPNRSLSVWILIGALWISIGLIVSAAVVTIAYLL